MTKEQPTRPVLVIYDSQHIGKVKNWVLKLFWKFQYYYTLASLHKSCQFSENIHLRAMFASFEHKFPRQTRTFPSARFFTPVLPFKGKNLINLYWRSSNAQPQLWTIVLQLSSDTSLSSLVNTNMHSFLFTDHFLPTSF